MTAETAETDPNDNTFPVAGPGGGAIAMRTLFYEKSSAHELHVVASEDSMRVYMKAVPGVNFSGIARETVLGALDSAGVRFGLLETGVRLFVNTQNGPNPFPGFFQLARGEPMRRGENGAIEFHVHPTAANPRYDQDAAGSVDYKQVNLIENCFAGQRVASVLPPGPGRPGRDVFGAEIPAAPGEPAVVFAGTGVIISSNAREFTAEIEGRVVFEENVLSVSPLLEISHDIDYAIGNVDFAGRVVVNGSLLDGFSIVARHGVEIRGDMGAGRIFSEGDVVIAGGVKGRGSAHIACRSLTVHYIDDADVEARGDVTATKEIMSSRVKALGRVRVTQGAIIGGEVCAFHGVEADTLGSDLGVATLVAAGLDWTEEEQRAAVRARIAEYAERLDAAALVLEPLLADRSIRTKLDAEQKSMIADLVSELSDLRERMNELLEERARLTAQFREGRVERINARKLVNMGVSARFSAFTSLVRDAAKGPLSITPNDRHTALSMGAFVELPEIDVSQEGSKETSQERSKDAPKDVSQSEGNDAQTPGQES